MSESDEPTRDLTQLSEAPQRDHYLVAPLPWLAGASDRGQRHQTNQDALSVAGVNTEDGQIAVLVISDGVSTSLGAEEAALAAAETASAHLVEVLRSSPDQPTLAAGLTAAFDAASAAVLQAPVAAPEPGSCTLIAAVWHDQRVSVGNVGDSRAYWLGDDGEHRLLSTDDSMAQVAVEMGMSREEAEKGFHSHAITRWLGPGSVDVTPRQVHFQPSSPGWLLVCSDGLWNYASSPDELAAVVAQTPSHEPTALASHLLDWANAQGGRDNISVAIARIEQVTGAGQGAAHG